MALFAVETIHAPLFPFFPLTIHGENFAIHCPEDRECFNPISPRHGKSLY